MLLWASKFATARIECSFEMGKYTPLGDNIYLAGGSILLLYIYILNVGHTMTSDSLGNLITFVFH